jgi:hypothetical protein
MPSKFVDIESPYSAPTPDGVKLNIRYARAAVTDCLRRGEIPYASHLFFTQTGILDDNVPKDREIGILAGKEIIEKLGATTVVYTDLGVSRGMQFGIEAAKSSGRPIEYRSLGEDWERGLLRREGEHSHNGVW